MADAYRSLKDRKTAAELKEENDRILAELRALPEGVEIERLAVVIADKRSAILRADKERDAFMAMHDNLVNPLRKEVEDAEAKIKALLIDVENASGYSKMPTSYGTYALMTVNANYQVIDNDAVPADFIVQKITSSVDKKMLNDAIKTGVIDVAAASNWLELRPAYKTLIRK